MPTAAKRRLTAQEYLQIERAAPIRSEFYNGEMFAMSGASLNHNRITANLATEFNVALKGGGGFAATKYLRIRIEATDSYCYPDIVIVYGQPELEDGVQDTPFNPRVIIEVLSPTTERCDRGAKFRNYRQIPSLKEYILVSQDSATVERHVRANDGSWHMTEFDGLQALFVFASVDVTTILAKIYRGVEFPQVVEKDVVTATPPNRTSKDAE